MKNPESHFWPGAFTAQNKTKEYLAFKQTHQRSKVWKHRRVFPVEAQVLGLRIRKVFLCRACLSCPKTVHEHPCALRYCTISRPWFFWHGCEMCSAINLYTVVKHATHDSPSQDLSGSFHHQCSSQLEILPAGYRSRYVRSFGVSIVSLFWSKLHDGAVECPNGWFSMCKSVFHFPSPLSTDRQSWRPCQAIVPCPSVLLVVHPVRMDLRSSHLCFSIGFVSAMQFRYWVLCQHVKWLWGSVASLWLTYSLWTRSV